MIELTLKGNYYEIGYQFAKQIDSLKLKPISAEFTDEQLEYAKECEIIVKQFFPEILEEIQGIVDGGNLEYKNIIATEISVGLKKSCTVFAIPAMYTKNNNLLFARSMDWFSDTILYSYICKTNPKNKISSLAFADSITGRLGGINEAGLVIGESNCVWGDFKPGLINSLIVRWILDNCKTVQEGVSFLERIPHIFGNNYLLADTKNTVARVEAYQRKTIVTYFQNKFVVTANHYFSQDFDEITPTKPKHSTDRIDFLNNWFNNQSKPIEITYIKELQKTHEVELCPHVQEYYNGQLMDLTTCWAWIHELGSQKIFLCDGSPCKNEYKEFSL